MTLTEYEKSSFQLLSELHSYLWPFPLKWDYANSKLVKNKPVIKWIPYFVELLYIWGFGWISLGIPIWAHYIHPHKQFKIIHLLIFLAGWAINCAVCFCLYLVCKNGNAIIAMLNELIELADEISEEFPDKTVCNKRSKQKENRNDVLFTYVLIPSVSSVPFSMTIGALISNLGIPYHFFEEILENPMYRDIETIWLALGLRAITNFLFCVEIIRSALFFLCCILILIRRITYIAKTLLVRCTNFKGFFVYYIQVCLLFKKIENVLHKCTYVTISLGFWATIIVSWACIRCDPEEVTAMGYACFLIGLALAIIGQTTIFPMLCQITELSEYVVKVHILRAKITFSKSKTRTNLANLKRMKAIVPYRLRYGPFWYLRKDFLPEYFELVVERVFDAFTLEI